MFMRIGSAGSRWGSLCRGSVLLLALSMGLAGCGEQAVPEPSAKPGSLSPAVQSPSVEQDLARFDRLVTLESVFPDRLQRGLYRMLPPVTENGQRAYTFQLVPQARMNEARHFNLVTIVWARGGTFVKPQGSPVVPSSTGGPNGGFIDAVAQTDDHAYDVRVSLAMLLPDSVDLPAFDVEKVAADMIRLYQAQGSDK
ncbi:MAG: hypothetical protein IPJ21_15820 [Sterolibacteriaceae bacterium]|nr:hypothetical protein [Sterolibacteriaceae bacterium]MBK9085240.1 hypothetical protein [Sterolibacteriaceae bacterium]